MAFFHWSIHVLKKQHLYYLKCYFINLAFRNNIFPLRCYNNLIENKSKLIIKTNFLINLILNDELKKSIR